MPSRGVKRKNKPLTSKGEKKKFSKKKLHLPNPHKPSVNWEQLKRLLISTEVEPHEEDKKATESDSVSQELDRQEVTENKSLPPLQSCSSGEEDSPVISQQTASSKKSASGDVASGVVNNESKNKSGVKCSAEDAPKSSKCEKKKSRTVSGVREESKRDRASRKRTAVTVTDDNEKRKKLKREDLWFDDVEVDIVDGEAVAKKPSTEAGQSHTALITGSDTRIGSCLALDCEMVGGGADGSYSMLARCSIVNHHGNIVYDKHIKPIDSVSDFRTKHSGIRPADLKQAIPFDTAQKEVSELLKNKILVGHALQNDLKALFLSHPRRLTRDTAHYRPFKRAVQSRNPSLKKLTKQLLKIDIQCGEHDSVTDARAAMRLYQVHKFQWEHAVGQDWSGQREQQQQHQQVKQEKWLPKRRRRTQMMKQQHKRSVMASVPISCDSLPGNSSEPFNVILHINDSS